MPAEVLSGIKGAVMQPYLFPYLGYFQLIRAAEVFVVYDDAQYMKGGWINRNRILMHGKPQWLTLPLYQASPNRRIDQIEAPMARRDGLLRTLRQCYGKAPHFHEVFPLLETILLHEERNLAGLVDHALRRLSEHLGLNPRWHLASALGVPAGLRGQDRVLALCAAAGIGHYVNLPGGRGLYDPAAFVGQGMRLSFLRPALAPYRQFGGDFVPGLSIVDALMFNDRPAMDRLLAGYGLDD